MTNLINKFKRDIGGIAWCALGVFLAMALASYHPADPSFNSASIGGGHKVLNLCGYFGSFLSDFLYQALGLSAWLFVLGAGRLSYFSFKGEKRTVEGMHRFLYAGLLLLVLSSLGSLYFPATKIFQGNISLGGILGALVSKGLVSVFNPAGVGVILWTSAAILIVFFTERRLAELSPISVERVRKFLAGWGEAFKKKKSVSIAMPPVEKPVISSAPQASLFLKEVSDEVPEEKKGFPILRTQILKTFRNKDVAPKTSRQVENWQLPNLELLNDPPGGPKKVDEREITRNARLVEQKLSEFDVLGQVVEVKPGPAVTMYEFRPASQYQDYGYNKISR